jgi:hypothetical protein
MNKPKESAIIPTQEWTIDMTKETPIEEITRKILKIIDNKVEDQISELNAKKYESAWLSLVDTINDEHAMAQRFYMDMKNKGLSLSMVESEGHLRGLKQVIEQIKHISNEYKLEE